MSTQPSAKQNLLESRRITRLLASLPDKHLLLLTKTNEQIRHWLVNRLMYTMVACAWWARMNGEDDPLRPLVRSKELRQNDYNRIWQLVECYERLWAVAQFTEPFIKEEFERLKLPYIFSSSYDLFLCVVQEQVNGEFSLCLSSYRVFSVKKRVRKYGELASRIRDGFPIPQTEPTPAPVDFINRTKHIFWSLLLLSVARQKAGNSKHRALRKALQSYDSSMADLFELEASYARRTGSFAWDDGERLKGSKDGTYKKSP